MTKATKGYQEVLKITGELDSALTWLHISDLHLSDRGRYDQEVILRALVASVKQFREEGRVPDLIVVTGDIAHSGKAEEYRQATLFFDDLLAAAGLDKRRLFVVPGNHDVDRTVNEFLPRTLDSDASSDKFFDPAGVAIAIQFQKLQAYSAWYNSYFAGFRSFPTDTTCSTVEVVQIRQVRVAMLLLNSALFCIDDQDHGKLLLGRRCLDKATKALQEQAADLNLALLHHPLDWLSAVERANIRATLGASVDLLLHGHYHETDTECTVSQHGGYLKLGAGASYQTREWPNCAMYATAQSGRVTIFPICYHDKPREVWALDTAIFPSPSYIGTFSLPKRVSPDVREAQALTTLDRDHLHDYHEALRRELDISNLLGTHALENVPVGLTDTFVALRLSDGWRSDCDLNVGEACQSSEQEQEQKFHEQIRKPEEVMRLVFEQQRLLLIIGDPGSGKTTLLKHYALTSLDDRKRLGFTEPLLVVFLPLRDLIVENGDYAPISHNLIAWSALHNLDIEEKHLSRWLQQRPTLLLFDGLDEISDPQQRIRACRWIDRIVASFKKAQVVVTSRSTGYRKAEGIELASRHTRADIMDFTSEQQQEFLEKWFRAAYLGELKPGSETQERWEKSQKEKAERKAKDIVLFLAQEKNRGVQALARVPLLLQIMAMLWKDRDYLPASRLKLYEAALNYILDYRDRQKGLEPLLPAEDALRVLAPVSLWMQEVVKRDEVERGAMQQQMQIQLKTLTKRYSAEEFCRNLVDRAGLLVEYRDREYLFRHKSFREYMAGLQLQKEWGREQRMATFAGYFGDDWWNEPLRFFIGQADAATFDAFMRELFNSPVSEEMTQKQQDLLTTLIEEAPQICFDALRSKLMEPETTLNRQRYLLQCLNAIGELEAHKEALEVVEQFNLSELSKERPLVAGTLNDPLGAEYLLIKGGSFDYSLTKKRETVPDLYVAKFTVTNRLFRQFISFLETKGSDVAGNLLFESYKKHLSALAESIKEFSSWLQQEKELSKRFASRYDDDKRFNKDDQPVIATWYAARAYCLWLSLLESDKDVFYRLPAEMEWEFAAAGEEGRSYPWPKERGEPTPKLANYNSNEGSTTPVGRYPEGATPEGLFDMAGNVWEWTDDWYGEKEGYRSVRGGSYYSSKADALRCSSRNDDLPGNWGSYNVGFRVIRSSHSFLPEHLIL
ncbi:SUMF1/EgtB/PvdO family nonheme iron enzyme [Pelodictyon phaeoclathratiforme]|jgi:formylglycine-generating enzyme required for sulfatase activity/predicted MPP superfamily phosphohydrolase|uniref:Putative signal transduction protein with Nacht domain n=1 Tax=Pelodictyon phaeoclathratiforme (strain DSM 5477 / BU-1) TaxID=324925 RepID=B4SG18_PELPB|nr:SUMF1/EgtB/PvdO family nonheme iron enzyme [Pelodictyon phaeoclathratiforme]ACF43329.1 putative signal transduction protein with Nacht domain [Pelodictyon phaeoclathratiforme BU-1]MBV5290637.1 SUMF1/EgtB/PvdO family nonheme iron enzyme [Pelodictyon phaeoclathratiforme]